MRDHTELLLSEAAKSAALSLDFWVCRNQVGGTALHFSFLGLQKCCIDPRF